jgi:hypothetical protein
MDLADRVEAELARAHDAVTAEDDAGADRALAHAEGLLRAHAELPNAAWLMAEVHRAWSSRWSRLPPHDPDRARIEWQRAAALDGGRSAGVGEGSAPREALIDASLVLAGEGAARLDGSPVQEGALKVAPGEHQLVVVQHGAIVWADWVSFSPNATVHVAVPDPAPCSTEDLAHARLFDGTVRASAVRCASWVAAAPGPAGSLLVATCEVGACGTVLEWSSRLPPFVPRAGEGAAHRWPRWATWTLVGVGVAATAVGVSLAASGAFRSSPASGQFVSGGLEVHGFHF